MLAILVASAVEELRGRLQKAGPGKARPAAHQNMIGAMSAAQILLAVLAFTSYHVQIITRISSAYPVWYWWVARCLGGERSALGKGIVKFMVMYALIQGVLYASFLPPA
jgi:GPI mannosyltransferase 2